MDSCLFEDLSRVYKMTWSASGQHRSAGLTVVWCTYTVGYGCPVSWSADFGTFVIWAIPCPFTAALLLVVVFVFVIVFIIVFVVVFVFVATEVAPSALKH